MSCEIIVANFADSVLAPEKEFPIMKKTQSLPPLERSVWDPSTPKRREKLVADFQKLYYHDTKGSSNSVVPLDQKVMQKGMNLTTQEDIYQDSLPPVAPRVDVIAPSSSIRPDLDRVNSLTIRKEICIHNAKCAAAIGQSDKADVWNILSDMLDSISSDSYDDFDGWHSLSGCALGRELLLNIFHFYECEGDIQMLATIVSVLGAGCRMNRSTSHETESNPLDLLLPEDDTRCDVYIHHYSALLYNWGKLNTRTELNKHLASPPAATRENDIFVPVCHEKQCNGFVNRKTNVCNICKKYAFRCSICTNAVRGLFTVCVLCKYSKDYLFLSNEMCLTLIAFPFLRWSWWSPKSYNVLVF
jgi:hypothetical protein